MQQSSAMHLAQHKLRLASCTQQPHHRIPSNVSSLFQNLKRPGEAFVDSTDLWLTSTSSSSSGTLISSLQTAAQLWERLLFASGRAMAIQKCFYYLVNWCWDQNGFPVLSSNITSSDTQLVMTSGRSTLTHTIPRVKNNIGRHTLGMHLSPDGSFEDKFSHCQQQALK